jgi:flagellar motility protein MotE (MotC chaperone)
MKKLISLGLVAGVLFAISASVSFFLRGSKATESEHKADPEETMGTAMTPTGVSPKILPSAPTPSTSTGSQSAQPGPVRIKYIPEAEVALQLANSLRAKDKMLKAQEEQLRNRKNNLDLVFKDIRGERAAIDELRNQVFDELKGVESLMDAVKKQREKLDEQKKKVESRVGELESRILELEGTEQDNIKKMAETYSLMDPEKAAKILQDMAENGKKETVVKILGMMTQRQAAKVFAELPQRLAGELMEMLKGFKRNKSTDRP